MKQFVILLIIFIKNIHAEEEKIIQDSCLSCLREASSKCSYIFPKNSSSRGPFYLSRDYWIKSRISQQVGFESCVDDDECAAEVVRKYVVKYTKTSLTNNDYALCYEYGKVHSNAVVKKFKVNRYYSFYCFYGMFNDCYIRFLEDVIDRKRVDAVPRWG